MRKYFRVMVRSSWGDAWVVQPQLEPVTSTLAAAPTLGRASFKLRYGYGVLEDGTPLVDGSAISSFRGKYIQIRADDLANFSTESVWWTGIIPAETYKLDGTDATVKSAEQMIQAITLGYLLDTRLEKTFVEPIGGGGTTLIDHMPVFNSKTSSGQIAGNRSAAKETFGIAPDEYTTHIFAGGDGAEVWTYADIIEFLTTEQYQLAGTLGGPHFEVRIPAAIQTALASMTGMFDFKGMTLRQALDALIGRGSGFGWVADVDTAGTAYIGVWSLLDTALTVGTVTMPAHEASDRVTIGMWDIDAYSDVRITPDATQVYDKIVARGGRIKTCCTFSVSDSTLEKAWATAEETAYKDAAKGTDGYAALSDNEKADKNDRFRAADRFRRAFSSFRVPTDWDWKIGAAFASPKFNAYTDVLDEEQNGGHWNGEKRFYPFLPFKEGFDYSQTVAVDKNPANTEPEYRKMFAVVKNADGKYSFVEQKKPVAGSVRPRPTELGVDVSFRPRHLTALNDFADAEISETDADFTTNACDYNDLKVTAMVETDQQLQLFHFGTTTETMRTMVIEVPGAEMWYVTAGTIVDIDADGDLVEFGETDNLARDDRDTLRSILAAAVAWYGKKRNRLTIRCGIVDTFTHIGQMVDDVNVEAAGSAAGTTVTEITINYSANENRQNMTIRTDHGELNLRSIHGATASLTGVPSLKVAGRKINKLEAEVAEIKKQQDKTPLRMEPAAVVSGGDSSVLAVVVKPPMYDDPDRVYPVGCAWTGCTAGDPWELADQKDYTVQLLSDSTAEYDAEKVGDPVGGVSYAVGDKCWFEVLAATTPMIEAFAEVGYGYPLMYECTTAISPGIGVAAGAFLYTSWTLVDDYAKGQWIIDRPIGWDETSAKRSSTDILDMRNYIPWFDITAIVPVITIDYGTTQTPDVKYLFKETFSYTGPADERSIGWNQEENRVMSVYK